MQTHIQSYGDADSIGLLRRSAAETKIGSWSGVSIAAILCVNVYVNNAFAQTAVATEAGSLVLPTIDVTASGTSPEQILQQRMTSFDTARDTAILTKLGVTSYNLDAAAIGILPQGSNTPIDKVLLQAPGVAADSAASGIDYHVRNEYGNVAYRINGIMLPDGLSGLGPVLETGFVGNLNLLTGTLPAQYGLRTAGIVDITSKTFTEPGGSVSIYGGSFGTVSPSFEYGGSAGDTQYYVTGRYMQNNLGVENATPTVDAVHDHTQQEKFFGYVSTLLGESNRLTFMTGTSVSAFQIPNNPGQMPLGNFGDPKLNSIKLNETEVDSFFFNILALQTKGQNFDTQFSMYSRYASVHFVPDIIGDLTFNDVASNIARESLLNGAQFDGSYRLNEQHTLRAGFGVSAEFTQVTNMSTVLPVDNAGNISANPFSITDYNSKLGWNIGGYLQDEWKITDNLTLNAGLRFDQMYQFINANQISPRATLLYKPFEDTSIHIGYARYFTPPIQAQATPTNLSLFNNTTQQPVIASDDPVKPERSHYFDVGIDKKVFEGLTVGVDAYYKIVANLIDDGQFGQALLFTQFGYANGYSEGVELKAKYHNEGFSAYANFSTGRTKAKDVNSNQYLFDDPLEFTYIASNYHFTDDTQLITASAGISYRWNGTLVTSDGVYGSGLRSGFANLTHVQPYTVFNFGISHDFDWGQKDKPLTVRFNVVNLLDTLYLLRDGSGIGEFAPQYGARRGFFVSLAQKL